MAQSDEIFLAEDASEFKRNDSEDSLAEAACDARFWANISCHNLIYVKGFNLKCCFRYFRNLRKLHKQRKLRLLIHDDVSEDGNRCAASG